MVIGCQPVAWGREGVKGWAEKVVAANRIGSIGWCKYRGRLNRLTYRHTWRAGDMPMWDNRCLLHRADPNFDAALHPRVLHRTCIQGLAPA